MAQHYKFFNSTTDDRRKYQAQDFADYFGSVLSTGLLHTNKVPGMQVSVEAGTLNSVVSAGKAIMKGHLYENTTPVTLAHSIPEPTLDRIDRIVLRLNLQNSERNILLHVKEGTSAANPVAPTLQRDQFIYEISLARIRVRKNTVQLLPTDVVDERLEEQICGLVYSLISIPTSQFLEEWTLFFSDLKADLTQVEQSFCQEMANKLVQAQSELDIYSTDLTAKLTQFENIFNIWFDDIKDTGFASQTEFATHLGDKNNPHGVNKAQIGLGNLTNDKQLPITGGQATGIVKAHPNTSYTIAQVRNIIISTANPSGGNDGDIWFKYV